MCAAVLDPPVTADQLRSRATELADEVTIVLERPARAAAFVAQALADVEVGQVAALLGISSRMVTNYRNGDVGALRKNPARVTLVAQIVNELLGSMSERGALLWFDARMLDGR